mmetsp:Transcript_23772/g.81219  ORF Transcript_23772/g.81219 Transcript_23772/m.81219 type:complete len:256 (-) Transcript_23772:501-1268(-)
MRRPIEIASWPRESRRRAAGGAGRRLRGPPRCRKRVDGRVRVDADGAPRTLLSARQHRLWTSRSSESSSRRGPPRELEVGARGLGGLQRFVLLRRRRMSHVTVEGRPGSAGLVSATMRLRATWDVALSNRRRARGSGPPSGCVAPSPERRAHALRQAGAQRRAASRALGGDRRPEPRGGGERVRVIEDIVDAPRGYAAVVVGAVLDGFADAGGNVADHGHLLVQGPYRLVDARVTAAGRLAALLEPACDGGCSGV